VVRINLIEPKQLSDQHLIAEYREILLLFGYYRKHPVIRPSDDHRCPMRFYQNKLLYLKNRFETLKDEMRTRNFKPQKHIELIHYDNSNFKDFEPNETQVRQIKERITQRINERPTWYRYYGEYKEPAFFEGLMENHKLEG